MTSIYSEAAIKLKKHLVDVVKQAGGDPRPYHRDLQLRCILHKDSNPSAFIRDPRGPNPQYYCFGCMSGGKGLDAVDLYRKLYGCGFREAVREMCNQYEPGLLEERKDAETDHYRASSRANSTASSPRPSASAPKVEGLRPPAPIPEETRAKYRRQIEDCYRAALPGAPYAEAFEKFADRRGLRPETLRRYRCGFCYWERFETGKYNRYSLGGISIPHEDDTFIVRSVAVDKPQNHDYRFKFKGDARPWGTRELEQVEPVLVHEGPLDAMSVIEAGFHACAVGNLSSVDRFAWRVKQRLDAGGSIPPLLDALDRDARGRQAAGILAGLLAQLGVKFYEGPAIFSAPALDEAGNEIPGKYRDANSLWRDQSQRQRMRASIFEAVNKAKAEHEESSR